jgi:hypothetical protein
VYFCKYFSKINMCLTKIIYPQRSPNFRTKFAHSDLLATLDGEAGGRLFGGGGGAEPPTSKEGKPRPNLRAEAAR